MPARSVRIVRIARQDSVLALLAWPAAAQADAWDARHVEHLYDRAGFGAGRAVIERGVRLGRAACLDELFAERPAAVAPAHERLRGNGEWRELREELDDEALGQRMAELRRDDREQLERHLDWWIGQLVGGEDVLRERMTLFWHGYFPSSQEEVKNSDELIAQLAFLRANALGSFRTLVHGIARDPAMLEYLDGDANRRESPNENFARELLELFTLGEGHYTEQDVKDVARAFTGWADWQGAFVFRRRQHDPGEKTILGQRGRFDGDGALEVVLARPECARHLAGRLLTYFEGVAPAAERQEHYAELLRETDYDVACFLRSLFEDPAFYAPAVVGGRIASPLDFLVGSARRLGVAPPPDLLRLGAAALGERLCFPPSVEGWPGGETWITTGALLLRGNLAGVLVGELSPRELLRPDDEAMGMGMDAEHARPAIPPELRGMGRVRWRPEPELARRAAEAEARSDAQLVDFLCDELLAVEVAGETRRALVAAWRSDGRHSTRRGAPGERSLRRLAHLVLSLPEAQLN